MVGPGAAWDRIALARKGYTFLLIVELLPLILLGALLEGRGLHLHGKYQPQLQLFHFFSTSDIVTFEVIQSLLFLATIWVSAFVVQKICQTFNNRAPFLPVFTAIAYGFCPLLLAHFLDYGATMNPVAGWLLGVGAAIWIFYQGVPRLMQPDPTHAFGVYISTIMVTVMTSGLVRLLTAMYLLGYMDFQHSWLARRLAHLLGH